MKKFGLVLLLTAMLGTNAFAQEEASESSSSSSSGENVKMQVVATKTSKAIRDTAVNVTVIDSEALESRTGESVVDVLRSSGVVISESWPGDPNAAAYVSIRGNDADGTVLLIDGQRVFVNMGQMYLLNNIPLGQIERIEILEGSSSFLYGSDARGGVISITTKNGMGQEGFSGSFGVSYGNNFDDFKAHQTKNYLNLNYGFANGSSIYFGGAAEYGNKFVSEYVNYNDSDNASYVDTFTSLENQKLDFLNYGFNAGGFIKISDTQNITISAMFNQDTRPFDYDQAIDDISSTSYAGTYMAQVLSMTDALVNIAYNWYALDNLDVKISTGLSYNKAGYEMYAYMGETQYGYKDDVMYFTNDFIWSSTEIFAAYYINDMFTVKGGYNLGVQHMEAIENTRLELSETSTSGYESQVDEKKYTAINNALFAGVDVNIDTDIGFDVDITAGGRYQLTTSSSSDDSVDTDPIHSWAAEFGLVINPIVEWMAIKVNAGRSFKLPEYGEAFMYSSPIYYPSGSAFWVSNPELEPETSWSYSGTLEFYPVKDVLTISASLFRTDVKNLIEQDDSGTYSSATLVTFKNIGEAMIWGYDIGANFSKTFGSHLIGATFGFEQIWAYDVTEAKSKDDYIHLDRPEYTISGNISWKHLDWGTMIRVSGNYYADGYIYQSDGSEVRTESLYSTLDLRIAQDLHAFINNMPEATLWFKVKNLLDHRVDAMEANPNYYNASYVSFFGDKYWQDGDYDNEGISFMVGFDMKF